MSGTAVIVSAGGVNTVMVLGPVTVGLLDNTGIFYMLHACFVVQLNFRSTSLCRISQKDFLYVSHFYMQVKWVICVDGSQLPPKKLMFLAVNF